MNEQPPNAAAPLSLPPESAATLRFIERETDSALAELSNRLGIQSTPELRARIIDCCLAEDTKHAAAELRSVVKLSLN